MGLSDKLGANYTSLKTKITHNSGTPHNSLNIVKQVGAALNEAIEYIVEGPTKEWTCWCGHKFKASGEWFPTAKIYCQAPHCPNPAYFISGDGAKLLDSGYKPDQHSKEELLAITSNKNKST